MSDTTDEYVSYGLEVSTMNIGCEIFLNGIAIFQDQGEGSSLRNITPAIQAGDNELTITLTAPPNDPGIAGFSATLEVSKFDQQFFRPVITLAKLSLEPDDLAELGLPIKKTFIVQLPFYPKITRQNSNDLQTFLDSIGTDNGISMEHFDRIAPALEYAINECANLSDNARFRYLDLQRRSQIAHLANQQLVCLATIAPEALNRWIKQVPDDLQTREWKVAILEHALFAITTYSAPSNVRDYLRTALADASSTPIDSIREREILTMIHRGRSQENKEQLINQALTELDQLSQPIGTYCKESLLDTLINDDMDALTSSSDSGEIAIPLAILHRISKFKFSPAQYESIISYMLSLAIERRNPEFESTLAKCLPSKPDKYYVAYRAAIFSALRSDKPALLHYSQRALELGVPPERFNDKAFSAYSQDSDFRALFR